MKFDNELKSGIDKNGKKYVYIELKITESTKKRVFLDSAEQELITILYNNRKENK